MTSPTAPPTRWGIAGSGNICHDFLNALECKKDKDKHHKVTQVTINFFITFYFPICEKLLFLLFGRPFLRTSCYSGRRGRRLLLLLLLVLGHRGLVFLVKLFVFLGVQILDELCGGE